MAINNKKNVKSMFSLLVKNAVRFIGSTIGIVKDDDATEGSLPLALYPHDYIENSLLEVENDLAELSIGDGDGEIPMWMRIEHSPNLSKRKLKRRIYRNLKYKNRMQKLIKKSELKSIKYSMKMKSSENNVDELYNLRKKYVLSTMESKEFSEKLAVKSNEYIKLRLLGRVMESNVHNGNTQTEYGFLKDEIKKLRIENETLKVKSRVVAIPEITEKPKVTKTVKSIEPNDMIKPKVKTTSLVEPNDMVKTKKKTVKKPVEKA